MRYTKELDTLWSKDVFIQEVSENGRWVTVKELNYKSKEHYFLLNSETTDAISLGQIVSNRYSNDSKWFGFIKPDHTFTLLNLKTEKKRIFKNISSFEFDTSGRYLVLKEQGTDNTHTLIVIDLSDMNIWKDSGVNEFYWVNDTAQLLISKKNQEFSKIYLLDCIKKTEVLVAESKEKTYDMIKLGRSGTSIVYIEQGKNSSTLVNYFMETGKSYKLNDLELQEFIPLSSISHKNLNISDDGLSVFFYRISDKDSNLKPSSMEVWQSTDPWIYSRMLKYKEQEQSYFLTLWDLKTNKVIPITDMEYPSVQYNPNHRQALIFNKMQYEPQYKQFEDVDLYLKDFITGENELIVSEQYNEQGFISLSPSGRYIAFFKNSFWWIYDSITHQTVNLTEGLNVSFERDEVSGVKDMKPFGAPGWSEDEKYIILYDNYDIWLIETNGNTKERITRGKESKITYRISRDQYKNDMNYLHLLNNHSGISYNLKEGFVLEVTDANFNTGYSKWDETLGLQNLYFNNKIVSDVLVRGGYLIFKQCRFDSPITIIKLNLNNKNAALIHQSNSKLLPFDLGKHEFFTYRNQDGIPLRGLLFYPANFKANKEYPMIVKLYEKIIKDDLLFKSPSDYEYTGFNLLRYLTNDYFVFIPTITYEVEYPGESILKAIEPAIDSILKKYSVDKHRIGLYGHSYGGYETAFLVTQTNIFSAAVAGAAVTNLVQYYHEIGWEWNKEQIWRLENQQYRMGDSYYKLKEAYKNNSPLSHIEQLETPLLLWTGKEDYNVNWTQSVSMFMAMKRLNKGGKLLLFDNETHYLINPDNQEALSLETFEWFEYYLKKEWSY
ncbi:prolyl oligopeptidase family serine peptidase [Xanthomarina sp.]|nr:prolyl oligopeptidase family serine peptidase [Xanthomarina sp.]